MPFLYDISDGDLVYRPKDFPDGAADRFLGTGYSGRGKRSAGYRNNPKMVNVKSKGPIPSGRWSIGAPRTSKVTGPFVMDLLAEVTTETFGRSAFQIHGDNAANDASSGCIILARGIRNEIAKIIRETGDNLLIVTP